MLIYYFELKKAAFWFNDFQQPSLGDIQMPLGLCDLPFRGLAALRVRRGGLLFLAKAQSLTSAGMAQ